MLQLSTTLLCRIDDIQDNSSLRRGIPAAHTVYGVARTISAAIYVIFISLQRALSSDQTEMIKLLTEMMMETWQKQAIEIYWRENYICPSKGNIWKWLREVRIRSVL
jgi:geranylgeranyl diphosphate synthase type 3